MQILDVRGKACPEPVIKAVALIESVEKPETVVVKVDNEIAVENLTKMAASRGLKSSSKKLSDTHYEVSIEVVEVEVKEEASDDNVVVAISGNTMGTGEEELGRNLLKGFIYALSTQESLPKTVVFYNSGVFMTTEGSEALEDLKSMESKGVEILSCGACLDYYHKKEKLEVGSVSNMYVIVEKLMKASHVVRP